MVPYYMDNCGNSRANTCIKAPTPGRGAVIRYKTNSRGNSAFLVIHDNFADRMAFEPAMGRSNFCPINFRRQGSGLPWL